MPIPVGRHRQYVLCIITQFTLAYLLILCPVGLKLRRKWEGLAYENAENRPPPGVPCTPKKTPWSMYAQFKKFNGSPGHAQVHTLE